MYWWAKSRNAVPHMSIVPGDFDEEMVKLRGSGDRVRETANNKRDR
jgi:hypothetical protein